MSKIKIYKRINKKFEELLKKSIKNLPEKPKDITEQYLVNLLVEFSDATKIKKFDEPVAFLYLKSKDISDKIEIGDGILFMGGFFPENLTKKGDCNLNYYMGIGKKSYGDVASRMGKRIKSVGELYTELSDNFENYVNLFNEVKYDAKETWNEKDLIILFKEYLESGNKNALKVLLKNGLA